MNTQPNSEEHAAERTAHPVLWLTDRGEWHQQRALEAAPRDLNLRITMRRAAHLEGLESLLPLLRTAEFIVTERNQPVTAEMIRQAPRLKLIVRLGSLSHDIDLAAAEAAGVQVAVQPVLGTIYCAEHALMMLLAVTKRLGRSLHAAMNAAHGLGAQRTDEDTFSFNWLGYTDIGTLVGRTVAIVGMGEIGVELARMLRPMRLEALLYNKRAPYPLAVQEDLNLTYASLTDCLARADVLVSLLPYSTETDFKNGGGLTAERLALMKPSAALVHLGSGSVLDELALIEALRMGRLAGAALDTYEFEPLQLDHPLVALARDPASNLLLTPHTAAASAPGGRTRDFEAIARFLGK